MNRDLNNQIFSGALILNWTGHGNEQNWAQERILGVDDINSWTNYDKLPCSSQQPALSVGLIILNAPLQANLFCSTQVAEV